MSFLTPADLFWTIPVGASILFLYLLKMRRQDLRVPAIFLWPALTADLRANAPFQKLRMSALLFMQLLAALAIIVALAGPLVRAHGLNGAATVIVVDDSTSMQATDVSPTRFEHCLLLVRSIIDSMRPSDRLALILAGSQTRIIFPLTGDKAQMRQALQSVEPSDAPSDMGEALRLASALVSEKSFAKIIVMSDGNFPRIADFSPGKAELTYEAVGTSDKNVAITSFSSGLTPSGSLQCFAALHNYDSSAASVKVAFSVDNDLLDARQVSVPASSNIYLSFNAPPAGRSAHLAISSDGDILSSDDTATIYLKGEGTVRALLVTDGDLFLENALSLDPAIRLEKSPEVPTYELSSSPGVGRYDLVVFDNVPPVPVKAAAEMSIGMPGKEFGVTDQGIYSSPRVIDWERNDPVTRFADFDNLNIQQAHKIAKITGMGVTTLVTGNDGPLIVSTQIMGKRTIYAGWSVLDSDFPLHVSFPIFIANSVAWLTTGTDRSTAEAGGLTEQTGHTFTVSTPDGTASLIMPNGMTQPLDGSSGAATVRSADVAGTYQIIGPGVKTTVAVNVLDEDASDIRPKPILDITGATVNAVQSQNTILSQFWRPIVCFVLLLLSAEWWLFVRRS